MCSRPTVRRTILTAFLYSVMMAMAARALAETNILGKPLEPCCEGVGFYRNGMCSTGEEDYGTHTVCASVTQKFLDYTKSRGNDLQTPHVAYGFKGLKPGDKWCLCAGRWKEALLAGKEYTPPIVPKSTNQATLRIVDVVTLLEHDISSSGPLTIQ